MKEEQDRQPLLKVEQLHLRYATSRGIISALEGIDLAIHKNETLVILGESGSGKSSLGRAVLRVLPRNTLDCRGRIFFEGEEISSLPEKDFRNRFCWEKISLVSQSAMNALNPVLRIGVQVAEPLLARKRLSRKKALERTAETFRIVGLPADFLNRYPFELSGGMRQRATLAMALVAEPKLVILDEPTSALDVICQGNIMNALKLIRRRTETSFLFITHDIATSSQLADRVGLMYAGNLVEVSPASSFFREPAHPYARMLMKSVPRLHGKKILEHIPGSPPDPFALPEGCRFIDRCPQKMGRCSQKPPFVKTGRDSGARCWLLKDGKLNGE